MLDALKRKKEIFWANPKKIPCEIVEEEAQ